MVKFQEHERRMLLAQMSRVGVGQPMSRVIPLTSLDRRSLNLEGDSAASEADLNAQAPPINSSVNPRASRT